MHKFVVNRSFSGTQATKTTQTETETETETKTRTLKPCLRW